MRLMLSTAKFNSERMAASMKGDFSNATELADYLVPRIERSYISVMMIVDILDRVMLSHHRRMTVPLAKRALEESGMIHRARQAG